MRLRVARRSHLREGASVGLVEAVVRAPDLLAVCTVLLKDAVEVRGFRRAAAVVDDGAVLRGVMQAFPGEMVERVSVGYDDVGPDVLNALGVRGPVVVPGPGSIPAFRFDSYLVFPLPGPEGTGVGAIVVEGERIDEVARDAAETYRQCGPAVARMLELERLRGGDAAARNRELERQRRRLEKASRAKSEFLAGVSHELRTPINAILGYTSLLLEGVYGEPTDRQADALEKVQAASDQLLALISDILDLSKIEAGQVSVDLEPLDLEEMTTDLAKTIEPMVRKKGLEFRLDVPDDPPPVRSDRTKVRQILLNLLSNAVKFTDDGSVTLRCRASSGDGRVRFAVADTGVGIEPDELDAIFEEFRQSTDTSREGRGGAGLGLTITRRLAGLLGGRIDVSSEPGEGSVFTVDLPLDPSEAPSGAHRDRVDGTSGAPSG